jgi:8-oxo-dGTP pyrophosphatase MutT (NUDIX family)
VKSIKNISRDLITAGGLVINKDSKVLFIYRKNKWDLPKGKLDEGENLEEAAIREVVEETGLDINNLHIKKPLLSTGYKSFPQYDEGIEEIVWVDFSNIEYYLSQSRKYIIPVFDYHLQKLNTKLKLVS